MLQNHEKTHLVCRNSVPDAICYTLKNPHLAKKQPPVLTIKYFTINEMLTLTILQVVFTGQSLLLQLCCHAQTDTRHCQFFLHCFR